MNRWLYWVMMIFGGGFTLVGLYLVFLYIIEAIFKRIGEGDQSLLFWYLPLLLFGIIGMKVGFWLLFKGRRLKRSYSERQDST